MIKSLFRDTPYLIEALILVVKNHSSRIDQVEQPKLFLRILHIHGMSIGMYNLCNQRDLFQSLDESEVSSNGQEIQISTTRKRPFS